MFPCFKWARHGYLKRWGVGVWYHLIPISIYIVLCTLNGYCSKNFNYMKISGIITLLKSLLWRSFLHTQHEAAVFRFIPDISLKSSVFKCQENWINDAFSDLSSLVRRYARSTQNPSVLLQPPIFSPVTPPAE